MKKTRKKGTNMDKRLMLWKIIGLLYLIGSLSTTINAYIQWGAQYAYPYACATILGYIFWKMYMALR